MKNFYKLIIFLFLLIYSPSFSQKDLEISREFKLITSKNLSNYLKPLFTSIGESWHSDYYNRANYSNTWSFGLDISGMGLLIPKSQQTYMAELPDKYGDTNIVENAELYKNQVIRNQKGTIEQPTLYGGMARPVFAAPQNHFPPDSFYKTVTFIEGNNISFMSGVPIAQLNIGLPTRSQLRFRFIPIPAEVPITYFAFNLNQNIDKFFSQLDMGETAGLALNLAYHSLKRDPGVDISAFSLGLHYSKTWDWLTLYCGAQYEDFGGTVKAIRKEDSLTSRISSPYAEIRNSEPLLVNLETFTNFRVTAGASLRYGILEFHTDIAYASQPVISAGLSIWFWESTNDLPYPDFNHKIPDLVHPMLEGYTNKFGEYVPEPITLNPINKVPLLLSLKAIGIKNGNEETLSKIQVEEFASRQLRAILPFVFFDDNSANIPSKYITLSQEKAKDFSIRDLLGQNAIGNYYHVLNIIGERLISYPNAKITITGCNSNIGKEKNNKKLSQQRAETIRDYFVNIWQIDNKRISVKVQNLPKIASNSKDPDGAAENRRVEISSDYMDLTAPSIIDDTLRKVSPDLIRFKPEITSGNDLKSWNLDLALQDNKIKSFKDSILPENIDYSLEYSSLFNSPNLKEFSYQMSWEDKDGDIATPTKYSIPVELLTMKVKEETSKADTIYKLFNLILFDYDKAKLGLQNQKIVDFIKAELAPNAIVRVIGYTDRIGDDKHNLKLASDRALATAKAINAPNTISLGKGESELIYDNSSPEGRFYCRTVVVEVKIPKR